MERYFYSCRNTFKLTLLKKKEFFLAVELMHETALCPTPTGGQKPHAELKDEVKRKNYWSSYDLNQPSNKIAAFYFFCQELLNFIFNLF